MIGNSVGDWLLVRMNSLAEAGIQEIPGGRQNRMELLTLPMRGVGIPEDLGVEAETPLLL